jgi:TonB-dependent starch-binding outer membrane protein SusC
MEKKWLISFPDRGSQKKLWKIMKLTIGMLIGFIMTVSANTYSQNTRLDINLQNTTIKGLFGYIEQNSEFVFLYRSEDFNTSKKVSIDVKGGTINEILDQALKEEKVVYDVYERQIVIQKAAESVVNAEQPQKKDISGKVSDSKGEPITGATVLVKGTTVGITTDFDGKFKLSIPADAKTLVFSFVGMKTQEVAIAGKTNFTVSLEDETIALDEIVAVGYGVQRKSDLTGASSRVSEKDMNKSIASSPVEMVQGRVPGVNVTQNNGEPGGGMTVRVRGSNSIRSGQEPLYVVDGIPLDNTNLTPTGGTAAGYGSGGNKNPLGFINPEDIETIDILKDASSTAIYGARGANGVVLITTKKGKKGEGIITFDSYMGVSNIREKMNVLSPSQFRNYTRADNSKLLDLGASTNWQDQIFRTAITQNYAIGLSGGGEKNTYNASFGYMDQEGIVYNSGVKKLNGSLKITQKAFNDRLLLTASLVASKQEDSRVPISEANGSGYEGDLIITALKSNPTFPVFNADGTYYQHSLDQRNAVAMMNLVDDKVNTLRVLANVSAEIEIIKGLKYKLNVGLDRANVERRVNQNKQLTYLSNKGEANINGIIANNMLIENYITYLTKIGQDHSFNFLLGHSYQDFNGNSHNTDVQGFVVEGIKYTDNLQYGNFSAANVSSAAYKRELQSFFGRINYSLRDKYLMTFTMRRDGSSKFGANNKYGNFPSAALAWRVNDEDFMKNVGLFSNLKVRLGWGITGNQEIPDKVSLLAVGTQTDANVYSNGVLLPGITFKRTPNPDIKWESTEQINFGLDFGFLKNRLTGTFDLFRKVTTDVLLEIPAKAPSPTATQWQNVPGLKIKNNGIELGLTGVMISKKDLNWEATVNVAGIKNNVTGLPTPIRTALAAGQGLSGTYVQLIANNQPIGSFYGMVFQGFDASGVSKYKMDSNGVAVQEFLGSALPDMTFSFSTTLKYKKFDVSMFWYGTQGNKVYNNTANALFVKGTLDKSSNVRADIATSVESPGNSNAFSSRFIEDGSFLRLSNLTFGYTINTKSIKWISKLRVYATGNNLLVLTNYKGFDPEINSDASSNGVPSLGVDYSSFPKSRTFTFGVNLQF